MKGGNSTFLQKAVEVYRDTQRHVSDDGGLSNDLCEILNSTEQTKFLIY
jgi:hypothetical protein